MSNDFSLKALVAQNRGLASHYLWDVNPMPEAASGRPLHLGCGRRVFDGFVNIDLIPQHADVIRWDFLDLWPEDLDNLAHGAFSEDCLEHFFLNEQVYILANVNRALQSGTTARILMPSVERLVESYLTNKAAIFNKPVGAIETGADQLNFGMRFTGHRWLHDRVSLARNGALCGFASTATACATSTVDLYNGLNLRSEADSASFATDLRKVRNVVRRFVEPGEVTGAELVEDLGNECRLFRSTDGRPSVTYTLPKKARCDHIACLNVRSSNVSSFDWNMKTLTLNDHGPVWHFDDMMKSKPCVNIVTQTELRSLVDETTEFSRFGFTAANRPGDYFTVGCLEIFELG